MSCHHSINNEFIFQVVFTAHQRAYWSLWSSILSKEPNKRTCTLILTYKSLKWSHLTTNDLKWPQINIKIDFKLPQWPQNFKWPQNLKWPQMPSNDLNDLKWPQMPSNDLKWPPWPQMSSNDLNNQITLMTSTHLVTSTMKLTSTISNNLNT